MLLHVVQQRCGVRLHSCPAYRDQHSRRTVLCHSITVVAFDYTRAASLSTRCSAADRNQGRRVLSPLKLSDSPVSFDYTRMRYLLYHVLQQLTSTMRSQTSVQRSAHKIASEQPGNRG